jgi:flagellar hook-length control protein FliK
MATAEAAQVTQDLGVATTISQASSHAQHAAAETGTQRAAPAAAQVGREIIRRFDGGNTSFELRLDPPELGRVEVRMEVSRDHKVTAVISADNPQALAEMARHARDLEQQLQSAGLELGENGLSFDLRQGREGGDAEQSAQGRGGGDDSAPAEQQQAQTARPLGLERWRGVRVDISV